MHKKRRKLRLGDTAATGTASLFLAVNLIVRDPSPVKAATPPQADIALVITMIFMALGLAIVAYGAWHERHVIAAQLRRRLELRLRLARRATYYPGLRRVIRLQRAWSQA